MNFTAQTVPYQQTGYFSRIITEYLSNATSLEVFYEHAVSAEGLEAAIVERDRFPTDRVLLVKMLEEQYAGLQSEEAVLKNLSSLAGEKTYTITTAHQPAIFTGNLYFIYKILHVVKIADVLNARHRDLHFVPVFYMGNEDADLDELGHIYLDNEKLVWDTKQTGAVGWMHTKGLEKIIQRIEGQFAGHAYGPELIHLLKTSYLDSETIQKATLKLLNSLFGKYGLVVLIPDQRLFKSVMRGVFKDDLTAHVPFQIVNYLIGRLSEQFPVQAKPREINLFYLKENIRERIDWKDGQFVVHKTNIHFSPAEMEKELANFPERFSPNVILRGLFQETILPNIAFVGGGGETAYWLELKDLFKHYRIPYPVLILRNSFLVVKKIWKSSLDKVGLTVLDTFQNAETLVKSYVRKNSTKQLNLQNETAQLRTFYSTLKNISGATDKTLEQHVGKLETQALKKINELEKKMMRAEKKNHEEAVRKIHEIRKALFPLDSLQERIENFIPWYADYGPAFIDLIYQHSLTIEQQFMILEEI